QYPGRSSHYSGAGFNKMYFTAHAVSNDEYQAWLAKVRGDAKLLDQKAFDELGAEKNHDWYPVTYYGSTEPGLFATIMARHAGDNHHYGMQHDGNGHAGHDAATPAAVEADGHAGHNANDEAGAASAAHGTSGE